MARWCHLRSELAPDQLFPSGRVLSFVAIEHEISLKPIGVGSATIILELSDASGKPVEFQMTGDWVILLHVTLPDGKKLKRQIDVRGVRPNKASC